MEYSYSNKRIKRFKEILEKKHGVSAALIFQEADIFYLTNFYGKNSNSALLFTEKINYLFVNFIYFEEAKKACSSNNIEIIMYEGEKNIYISDILKSSSTSDILIQSDFIDHSDYLKIKKQLSEINIKSKESEKPLEELRLIKDEDEKDCIRKACSFADDIYTHLCSKEYKYFLNINEYSLVLEMEKFLFESAASKKSFDFVVANNANSSKPHYEPGSKKIEEGIILMDYGAVYNNYCSDITRTFFLGEKQNKKLIEIYKLVNQAQQAALDFCKEGIEAKQLDKIARDIISKKGYGDNFGHSLGHGVGIEIHEPPWINKNNTSVLKEGMILTVEPGIYIENLGGVRIEDMVLVKKNGCEILYSSTKELIKII